MILSPHFSLEELTQTTHHEINNAPAPEIIENLKLLAAELEKVRALLGNPMKVLSGYRCKALNDRIGGSSKSRHMEGLACDFFCPGYGFIIDICKAIAKSDLPYDQLIYEKGWTHYGIARKDEEPRREVLTLVGPNTYATGIIP